MPEISVEKPFPEYALPRVWEWIQEFRNRVCDDFAPADLDGFLADYHAKAAAGVETWGVVRDGELGGLISFQRLSPVLGTSHLLFKRSFWGQDTTIPAVRMVYEQAFGTGVSKIMSLVFRDNRAVISFAQKLGAHREGTFYRHTQRNGKLVDMVALGLSKEDFEKCLGKQ
ncbi:MAG TPA: GNAT family protein [Bryobacteraceae bacterium]|nr:GNAT family protein [Bryobacteraceae bacterium]